MLTPLQIQKLAEPVEDIYFRIVDDLLRNIARHIQSPTWTRTASWEIQKLSELGQLTRENAEIIRKWAKRVPPAMREAMTETRRRTLEEIERDMAKAVKSGYLTPPMSDSTEEVLKDMLAQADEKMNLTNTTMLQSSANEYTRTVQDVTRRIGDPLSQETLDVLNKAAASVATSAETRTAAVRRAILDLNERGLSGFVDRAGRSWSPEAYVNMVVRTTVHNTAIQSTRARMEDYGTSVFQVSSHAGARPLCYPYQGKFYSWNNTSGEIQLGDGSYVHYEPLDSTSYGEPAGLFGINCGHEPIPMVTGVSIPHAQDFVQDKAANEKEYQESQQQRALEREIRSAKRAVYMLGDNATKADKDRVREAQAQMRDFIAQTGRTRRPDREQIVT